MKTDTVILPAFLVAYCKENNIDLRVFAEAWKKYREAVALREAAWLGNKQKHGYAQAFGLNPVSSNSEEDLSKKVEKIDFLKINRMFG